MQALSTLPQASEPRLLVVEPDELRRQRIVAAIEREGYELVVLEAPEDVLANVDALRPDVVVLSTDLGRFTGMQVCGELRARETDHHTPVLLVGAGEQDDATVGSALLAGADDFVPSPERSLELRARVRVHLRYKSLLNRLGSLREQRDHLRREALFDPLTNLLNRRGLESAVTKQLHKAARFSALFLDIDHFKKVNDSFGHAAGDEILRQVAACMRAKARQNDVCARYGGEEFVMLLDGADSDVARAVAERHRRAIEALRFTDKTLPPSVTVSIGAATFEPASPETAHVFLARADGALYEAKSQGRNRVAVALPPRSPVTVLERAEAQLLRDLDGGRAQLPVLPDVAAEVLRLAEDPNAGLDRVARVVERAPPIAARLLAIANSALYAGTSRIGSPRHAVTRLGLSATRDLLLQIAYESSLSSTKRFTAIIERAFQRSVVAALAARIAGRELSISSPYDYLIGLLHDIGEALVVRLLGEQAGEPLPEDALTLLVERHHARAGAQVLRLWRVPDEVVAVALGHHEPGPPKTEAIRLARISDAVCDAIRTGHDRDDAWAELEVMPAARTRLIELTKAALRT